MNKAHSPRPSGRDDDTGGAVAQGGNAIPLHKRLAQGYTPDTSGPKTKP